MNVLFYAPLKSPDHPVPSGDRLIGVQLLTEDQQIFLASDTGKAIRFSATDARYSRMPCGSRWRP